jgi:hypothetical protein
MKKNIPTYIALLAILFFSGVVQAQNRSQGSLAWRQLFDFDDVESKEELFDLLLGELFFSADFGFKARDVNYSTVGGAFTGDQPLYMAQGEIIPTASYLDFAVIGEGFFRVDIDETQHLYTRNGNFQLDAQGRVVTEEGYRLYPPLQLDRADLSRLSIERNRTLVVTRNGVAQDLYDFHLFLPENPQDESLISSSSGLLHFSASRQVTENTTIQIRSLELSTVKVERILARLSELLFRIKAENPGSDYEFRFYMLDHLLKSQLQMGQTAQSIKRFSDLVKGVAPLLLFDQAKR